MYVYIVFQEMYFLSDDKRMIFIDSVWKDLEDADKRRLDLEHAEELCPDPSCDEMYFFVESYEVR